MVQWLRLHALSAEGLGFIHGQGTRSHMAQLRVYATTKDPTYINDDGRSCMPQLRPSTKQINTFFFLKNEVLIHTTTWMNLEKANIFI